MGMQKFSKGEAVKFGWQTVKANFGFLLLVLLVTMTVPGALNFVSVPLASVSIALSILAQLASWSANIIFGMGLINISLKFCAGQKPVFEDLFSCARLMPFLYYLTASVFYMLIMFCGFLLLIIPGIIWAIGFQLAPYFVVDKGMDPLEALKKSWAATRGAKWDLFIFGLLLGLINMLGFLALMVGLLFTLPLSMVAMAYVYRKLAVQAGPVVQVA